MDRTDSKSDTQLTQASSRPVRYELIDKFGMLRGRFYEAQEAAQAAKRIWPDQEQDEDRTGRGWDVRVVGS